MGMGHGDPKHSPELPGWVESGHSKGSLHARVFSSGPRLPRGVCLKIAQGDGFETFRSKAGDPLPHRNYLNKTQHGRRYVLRCSEVQLAVFKPVPGSGNAAKVGEDCLQGVIKG